MNITTKKKLPTTIYAEMTPNPASMKFVANRMLISEGEVVEYSSIEEATGSSELAMQIFQFPFVSSVFIQANYITVTKTEVVSWDDITVELKEFITDYLKVNEEIIQVLPKPESTNVAPVIEPDISTKTNDEISNKIIAILDEYVKPAVEGDGGAINFISFKEGIVNVVMRGSCSGCPSATVTLKQGIEGLLKKMLPEVKAVEAVEM